MSAERDSDAFKVDLIAVLADDVATGNSVAQHVLQSLGDPHDALAGANNEDLAHRIEVERIGPCDRRSTGLKQGFSDEETTAVQTNEPQGGFIRVGGIEASLKDLEAVAATQAVPV